MNLINLAIIAHVDHGKTTLIDNMLKQSGTFRDNQEVAERVMDSNDLEKERGITILAKCTSITKNDIKFNIIDTPGHADFGGEVERVLSMVDGVLLLVDASEGPMPQTKFVLSKALELNLKPIVVINKVDKPDARINEVIDEVYDLFINLDATEDQLDFPIIYASGRNGWASKEQDVKKDDLEDLFEAIKTYIPRTKQETDKPFSMLATILDSDPYLGRILTGKIYTGKVKVNDMVKVIDLNNKLVEKFRVTKLLSFKGITKFPVDEVSAGDIACIAGLTVGTVSNTICAQEVEQSIESKPVSPPTMSITVSVNSSPLSGTEGTKLTSSMIKERLAKESETNVAIKITESDSKDSYEVSGRGELQLGVLIENMRREGFELSISRPKVLLKKDENGETLEPIEELVIDVDEEFGGIVIEKLSSRKAEIIDMRTSLGGKTRIVMLIPSRCLIGYQSEFLSDTRGTGVLNRLFHNYGPHKGEIKGRNNGVLISTEAGATVAYALNSLEDRGILFVSPQEKVYVGMIIGEHNRDNDLEVNPVKTKQLTNMRAAGKDDAIKLSPPRKLSLEEAISYIEDDELVEVTPKTIRLRKLYLNSTDRKRFGKK